MTPSENLTSKPIISAKHITPQEIARVTEKILAEKNLDFRHYKHSFLARRLSRRIQFSHTNNIDNYLDRISNDSAEYQLLLRDLVIQVSEFFRDAPVFQYLDTVVIPNIIEEVRNRGSKTIKVWCPGCATGEEVFSITILLLEQLEEIAEDIDILVYGTDISMNALEIARTTNYHVNKLKNISERLKKKYFIKQGEMFKLLPIVKEKVKLGFHDLVHDPPINHLNMLICRNVCIYLERQLQNDLFEKFTYALDERGYLLLGKAESLTDNTKSNFRALEQRFRIFQKK